jgi:hypothetical protein
MSGGAGVWVFRDGVMQLLPAAGGSSRRKALVYLPTGEVLERRPAALERRGESYYENRSLVQLHRRDGGADLIALPRDFARFPLHAHVRRRGEEPRPLQGRRPPELNKSMHPSVCLTARVLVCSILPAVALHCDRTLAGWD